MTREQYLKAAGDRATSEQRAMLDELERIGHHAGLSVRNTFVSERGSVCCVLNPRVERARSLRYGTYGPGLLRDLPGLLRKARRGKREWERREAERHVGAYI